MAITEPRKSPLIAALLNAIPLPLGIGYIYLGQPARFAAVLAMQTFGPPTEG